MPAPMTTILRSYAASAGQADPMTTALRGYAASAGQAGPMTTALRGYAASARHASPHDDRPPQLRLPTRPRRACHAEARRAKAGRAWAGLNCRLMGL
jgi:hypothetical protein